MKKIFSILAYTIVISAFSCMAQPSNFNLNNLLLPSQLIISDHVGFDTLFNQQGTSQGPFVVQKPFFEMVRKLDMLGIIANKALSNSLKVYSAEFDGDYYPYSAIATDSILSEAQLRKNLGEEESIVTTDNPDGSMTQATVLKVIVPEELSSLNFIEEWVLTANPLKFVKKVLAYEPVRRYLDNHSDYEQYRYQKAFRVINPQPSKVPNANRKLAAQIRYEYFFYSHETYTFYDYSFLVTKCLERADECSDITTSSNYAPYFNKMSQKVFIKLLMENALSGKIPVKEYNSAKTLSKSELANKIIRDVPLQYFDIKGNLADTIIKTDITDEISALVFVEDWYLDTVTMQLDKKVTAIAPVRYYLDYSNEASTVMREILFEIPLANE
jgi:hypothetical protein